MSDFLSRRQRQAPPMDLTDARRRTSGGGRDEVTGPRTLAPGMDDERSRYPGNFFDTRILYDRGPYYQRPRFTPAGQSWVNWTAAGPSRPELHMRAVTLRQMVGNSTARFPVVATPTTGMHTMYSPATARTQPRYVQTPQMVGTRQMRLSPSRYANQTYSQTTKLQGAR